MDWSSDNNTLFITGKQQYWHFMRVEDIDSNKAEKNKKAELHSRQQVRISWIDTV